jgi:hypothetical protein
MSFGNGVSIAASVIISIACTAIVSTKVFAHDPAETTRHHHHHHQGTVHHSRPMRHPQPRRSFRSQAACIGASIIVWLLKYHSGAAARTESRAGQKNCWNCAFAGRFRNRKSRRRFSLALVRSAAGPE